MARVFQIVPAIITTVWLVVWDLASCSRPQCLEGLPPFEPQPELPFCQEYSTFGCCTSGDDSLVKAAVDAMWQQVDSEWEETEKKAAQEAGCRELSKAILCQRCSPYEGQIYAASATGTGQAFPGLCRGYCEDFFSKCKDLVPLITNDSRILDSLTDAESFCSVVSLDDPTFCYPNVTTDGDLSEKLSREYRQTEGCLCLEPFADDLRNPVLLKAAPGDNKDRSLFVAEQRGIVHTFQKDGTKSDVVFVDLSHLVLTSVSEQDERGFLGLAFHPRHADNGKLYMYFSVEHEGLEHRTRVSQFTVHGSNPNKVNISSERVILEVVQPYERENGGELLFGTDGYLYVFLGDGGGGLQYDFAQNKSVLLGKVLRLDVDTYSPGTAYGIPDDNPFVNSDDGDIRPEIYAYGVRNMWRCDVDEGDPQTGYGRGRILCGDVGHDKFEEINIVEKGGNYGWNWKEGYDQCLRSDHCQETLESEVLPIHVYSNSEPGQAVIGGHIYRGCNYPNLQGLYFYGDFVTGSISRLQENVTSKQWSSKEVTMCSAEICDNNLVNVYGANILSFGEDDDGELYLLTTNFASTADNTGKIFKFVDPRRRADPSSLENCRTDKSTQPNGANNVRVNSIPAVGMCLLVAVWTTFNLDVYS